jgi:hypothetical protein
MDHETAFVKAFIERGKWARYLQLLPDKSRRGELLGRLNNKLDYVREFATEVPGDQDYPEKLEKLLKGLGAPATCHVLVKGLRIDGRELPLREALDTLCLHMYGSLISCLPGRLAYYRPEAPGAGVILVKTD